MYKGVLKVEHAITNPERLLVSKNQYSQAFTFIALDVEHLLSRGLDLEVRRPLSEPLIYRSYDSCHAWRVRCGARSGVGKDDAHDHGLPFCDDADFVVV